MVALLAAFCDGAAFGLAKRTAAAASGFGLRGFFIPCIAFGLLGRFQTNRARRQAQDKLVALYACGVMVATITSCLTQEKKRETLAINS